MNVLFIGNAIIDIISHVDEIDKINQDFIGKMQIVTPNEINDRLELISNKKILSGGSANNSACGLSVLNEKISFIGKIGKDYYGKIYLEQTEKHHIKTTHMVFDDKSTTGLSLIYVTPDGERTMNTCLGASENLNAFDIPQAAFEEISGVFVEGYLFYSPCGIELVYESINRTITNNGFTAISLSDVSCVDKYRNQFLELIKTNKISLLFGNKAEMMSLLEVGNEVDLMKKMAELSGFVEKLVMTSGKEGSLSMEKGILYSSESNYVEECIDSTGAGDLFVSGYLKAYLNKSCPIDCLKAGNYLASKILQRDGGKLDLSDIEEIQNEIRKYIL